MARTICSIRTSYRSSVSISLNARCRCRTTGFKFCRVRVSDARLVEKGARRESAQRNTRIALVPFEPAVFNGGATGIVLRVVEDGKAGPGPVHPRLEVRQAYAEVHRQPLAHLPVVLHEAFIRAVGLVVKVSEGSLVVAFQVA